MLYAIYVAELEKVNSQECKIIQYADDVCIFSAMDLIEESLNRFESAADKISASLDNLGLILSKKTKLCVFSKNNKALKTQVRRGNVVKYNKKIFFGFREKLLQILR